MCAAAVRMERFDVLEPGGATGHGLHDLVQVDGLERAVTLAHPHLDAAVVGKRPGLLMCGVLLLAGLDVLGKCHFVPFVLQF